MFEKFSRSWELVKASAAVLRSDKELMLFPVISTIATLVVLATFAIPTFTLRLFEGGVGVFGVPPPPAPLVAQSCRREGSTGFRRRPVRVPDPAAAGRHRRAVPRPSAAPPGTAAVR